MAQIAIPRICGADELSADMARFGIEISPARLAELAEAGYLPAVAVDGQWPRFVKSEAKEWIVDHLIVRKAARPFPANLRVIDPDARPSLAADLPQALVGMAGHVWEFPLSNVVRGGAIYFLSRAGRVVYVGQSVTLNARIATHSGAERIEFDRVYYLNVPDSELDAIEAAFVRVLQPECNGKLKRPELPGDRELIGRVCNISVEAVPVAS